MALAPGTRVGSFEIVAKLGEGGMGEVYRARDAALNRDVAIKVLPDAAVGDAERRARFSREAQTLAALNHPNIAHIYGFESQANALVMELVEGQDLSALIAAGLPLSDILPIARQIADALEAAHEQGIVHRDLKPANVKVRTDGTVKVLDFGLAKALDSNASSATADAMNSPTLTARATQLGVILGTAAYMSPEQAKGKPVDKRADIWAFGVVLYEMLTGRRAFEGEDISTTLAHVLMKDPEWAALPADTPPALRILVERCLERDVRMRLRDIGEARVMLARPDALRGSVANAPNSAAQVSPRRSSWLIWTIASVGVVAAALAGAWGARQYRATPGDQPALRYSITTPAVGSPMVLPSFALSPDGRYLVYAGLNPSSGSTMLWVRPTNELSARVLPGTDGASGPFWAPDNRRIGFAAAGKLKITAIDGGLPTPVCDYPTGNFLGGTWNAEGTILLSISSTGASYVIARVSEHGGALSDVVKPDQVLQQTSLYWPFFLSDGRHFVYTAWSNTPERRGIFLGSLDGGPPALLIQAPSAGIVASGFLLYVNDGQLLARAFDGTTLQSEARKLADDVTLQRMSGRMAVTASQTGVLAFRSGTSADPQANLVWVNRSGQQLSVIGKAAPINQVRLSPDERRVAVTQADPRTALYNVHVLELSNNIISQVTFEESSNDPMWGPDSQTVAFEALPKGKRDFYSQVIGARTTTPIYVADEDPKWIDDWSRDGQFMLFHLPPPCKLFALPLKGDRKPFLLAESTKNIDAAHFSNDGKWVAYGNNESGSYEVWVAAFPAFDHRHQVSSQGGSQPWFRGDGRELFYLTLDGKLMSVGITPDAARNELTFSAPVLLFQSPLSRSTPTIDQYAVTKDGQRFLFVRPLQEDLSTAAAPITFLANWIQALK